MRTSAGGPDRLREAKCDKYRSAAVRGFWGRAGRGFAEHTQCSGSSGWKYIVRFPFLVEDTGSILFFRLPVGIDAGNGSVVRRNTGHKTVVRPVGVVARMFRHPLSSGTQVTSKGQVDFSITG